MKRSVNILFILLSLMGPIMAESCHYQVKNVSDKKIDKITVVVKTQYDTNPWYAWATETKEYTNLEAGKSPDPLWFNVENSMLMQVTVIIGTKSFSWGSIATDSSKWRDDNGKIITIGADAITVSNW